MAVKKFHFEGIAKDGKILSGFLFSENKDTARKKLAEQGFAVLTLKPYMQKKTIIDGFSVFEFKALTDRGEEIRGNIEAKTLYSAYKKIRTEYNYKLLYLIPNDLPFEQKEELKKQGIDPQWEELLKEDQRTKQTQKNKTKKKNKNEQKNEKMISIIEEKKEMMDFFQKEIDYAVKEIKSLIQENQKYLDPARYRNIENSINTLLRLRQSNAVEHLEGILREIFSKLSDTQMFLSFSNKNNTNLLAQKLEFQKLSQKLENKLNKGLAEVDIGTINTETIKTTVQNLHIFQKIGRTVYWIHVFLFIMVLCFWILNILQLFLGWNIPKAKFYFSSSNFWFITGFTGLISFLFLSEIFRSKPSSWTQKTILYLIATVLVILFVLEFPVLFFWTNKILI
jgi:hypothetical protein